MKIINAEDPREELSCREGTIFKSMLYRGVSEVRLTTNPAIKKRIGVRTSRNLYLLI